MAELEEPLHNPSDEILQEDSSAVVITYLRQLVRNYEDLVQDMSKTLHKNRDELATVQRELQAEPSPSSSSSTTIATIAATGKPSLSPCENCENSHKAITNLTNQVESLTKAKKLTTTLWHSSAEQIEQLENRLKNKLLTSDTAMKTSTDNQIKLFQSYITRLEGRLEQTSSEKNFYRRKLMESKLEKEAAIKDILIEKQKEFEMMKGNYVKEIEHLKQILEKERQVYITSLEKRLEDERKVWTKEEKERRDNLKQTWLSQLKPLVLEQETLLFRESQLSEKLHQTQLELYQAKQLLWFPPQPQQQQQQQPQFQAGMVFSSSGQSGPGQGQGQSVISVKPDASASILKPTEKVKFVDLNYDYPQLEKYDDGAWASSYRRRKGHGNCDHEECVQYSMHQQVLNENERLGEEMSRLQRSKHMAEIEQRQNASRLEQRIRDLEHLNYSLQLKLLNPNEAFAVLDRGETRDDILTAAAKRSQRNNSNTNGNSNLKSRPGSGDKEVLQDRNNYSINFSQTEDYQQQQLIGVGDAFLQFASAGSGSSQMPQPTQEFQMTVMSSSTHNNNNNNSLSRSRARHLKRYENDEEKHILNMKRSTSATRDRDRDRDRERDPLSKYFSPIILDSRNHNAGTGSGQVLKSENAQSHNRSERVAVEHYSRELREVQLRQKFFDEQRRLLREKSLISNGYEGQG